MVFESPIWLVGLLPWVMVFWRVLPGSSRPEAVPFLRLWKSSSITASSSARRIPPVSILLFLSALLLVILAASGPAVFSSDIDTQPITIILDRGASMALPSAAGRPFRGVIDKCRQQIANSHAPVQLIAVPGERIETTTDRWADIAGRLKPTILPIDIDATVRHELSVSRNPIWVLSDQLIDSREARVHQVVPDTPEEFVAITSVGARLTPHPQVMVRLENHSVRSSINLIIQSGEYSAQQTVRLNMNGTPSQVFVDLPKFGKSIEARIDSGAEGNPWARAFLIRQSNGVALVEEGALPAGLHRLIEVYSHDRPTHAQSQVVVVSTSPLHENQTGIYLNSATPLPKVEELNSVQVHPLTQNIASWPATLNAIHPPDGFRALVSTGTDVLLAVRETPARQIWMNANFESWQNKTDFVVLFANAFAWLGGDVTYQALASPQPDKPWPGIYRTVAVNAGSIPSNIRAGLNAPVESIPKSRGRSSIAAVTLLGALGCLLIGAFIAAEQRTS